MLENRHRSSSMTTSRTAEIELLSEKTPFITTENAYRQIVVNLTAHYPYLQQYYNLNEDAMADKIVEIARKICSKI